MFEVYKKEDFHQLCFGLTSKEFGCGCRAAFCRHIVVSNKLISAYQKFRNVINLPLTINSGYRCAMHNYIVGGVPLSYHLTGRAIDISLKNLNHLTTNDIEYLARTSGFSYVQFYKSFVHLDVR